MTAAQAVTIFDRDFENDIPHEDKIRWLWQLDGMIYNDIISTHDDAEEKQTNANDYNRELLAPSPYDDMYIWYLRGRAHMRVGEIDLYNNAFAAYSVTYDEFAKFYNRTHMPKGETIRNYTGW